MTIAKVRCQNHQPPRRFRPLTVRRANISNRGHLRSEHKMSEARPVDSILWVVQENQASPNMHLFG